MKKILIVTAPYGAGHIMVKDAIREELEKYDDIQIEEIDMFYEFFPEALVELTRATHMMTFKPVVSDIYGVTYRVIDKIAPSWDTYIQGGVAPTLKKFLDTKKYDAIIQTFPVKQLSNYKKRYDEDLKLYTIVTDYYAQGRWFTPHLNKLFVPTELVKEDALERGGYEDEDVIVSGMPVRSQFTQIKNVENDLHEKLALDINRRTIIVTLGAGSVSSEILPSLKKLGSQDKYNIIVMCGRSKELYNRVDKIQGVTPVGYVTEVADYFRIADLVITKAGGLTISEVSNIGRAMLFVPPQPGQEEANAKYFMVKGAAYIIDTNDAVAYANEILDSERYIRMGEDCRSIGRSNACQTIVDTVLCEIK